MATEASSNLLPCSALLPYPDLIWSYLREALLAIFYFFQELFWDTCYIYRWQFSWIKTLIQCCTRLSVGMIQRLGTRWWLPIPGSVFFEPIFANFVQFFCQKHMPLTLPTWKKKDCWSKLYFDPLKSGGFYGRCHSFRVRVAFSKIEGPHLWWEPRLGCFWPRLCENAFFRTENTLKMTETFSKPSSNVQNLHFAKKTVKNDQPSLPLWRKHYPLNEVTTTN